MKRKFNHARRIEIPQEIPENFVAHYMALEKAKIVIGILSLSPQLEKVDFFGYSITPERFRTTQLPSKYIFDNFYIRFLPGWGKYIVTLPNKQEINMCLPENGKDFEQDISDIRFFISKCGRSNLKLIAFRKAIELPRKERMEYFHAALQEIERYS